MAKHSKPSLVQHLQRAVEKRAGSSARGAEDASRFAKQLFQNLPAGDMAPDPAAMAESALSLWHLGQSRRAGTAKVRVINPPKTKPDRAKAVAARPRTAIEIVNDDMPFLVDSVSAALTNRGISILELYHPIVSVLRDGKGARLALGGKPAAAGKAIAESWMRIEIDAQSDAAARQIQKWIEDTLADVRMAVTDWKSILAKLDSTIRDLERNPPPLPAGEVAEGKALLAWMRENHFTFLGYREYAYAVTRSDGGGGEAFSVVPGSGLGLLRDPRRHIMRPVQNAFDAAPEVLEFLRQPELLIVLKANFRSTVHRPVHLDFVAVKLFDKRGRAVGERRFVGLFTSTAYSRNPSDIPYLRRKIERVMAASKLDPASHDGKALRNILETYPRDDLFQISEADLARIGDGVLALVVRPRLGLFVRQDKFQRFVSCLIYAPREKYDTELRHKFEAILVRAYSGRLSTHYTLMGDDALARVQLVIATKPGAVPRPDLRALQAELERAARSWADDAHDALAAMRPPAEAARLEARYVQAFPAAYREAAGAQTALADIAVLESLNEQNPLAVRLAPKADGRATLKLYHRKGPIALSDCLPVLENAGFRLLKEQPYELTPPAPSKKVTSTVRFLPPPGQSDAGSLPEAATLAAAADASLPFAWIHELDMERAGAGPALSPRTLANFEEMFLKVWFRDCEDDGFNRLVIAADLGWREVMLLRAYAKYVRQIGTSFSESYMAATLAGHPGLATALVHLFRARFDPAAASKKTAAKTLEKMHLAIEAALEAVSNLDQDRILRQFLNLIEATTRTNYFQTGAGGQISGTAQKALALKFNPRLVRDLPKPVPFAEISVYSPRVEGVHLRGGKVARGGIRWSDRREDFRTEVLGLMKAQMVKNAVIVPVGAKGGFLPKRLPAAANREAYLAEGVASYKLFINALLDITDNLAAGKIKPPAAVVRHDGDDPYLVVAADKGTATFSDIANAQARAAGFWLDDAFASGGSAGYDHKKMGITARGAWELVKRHFRELGRDIQSQDFTVIGVGDMSGDVFGNGMLLSPHIKLLAAFDHRHIFVDPDPDPRASLAERKRLFALPRSSWADFDPKRLSKGAAIFERSAKTAQLTPEIKARFAIAADKLTPAELIRTLLRAEADLLWLGGIGTYVKSSLERHAEVGDRANEAIRVNGNELRVKVVGEGANLGCTQRGRIEFARTRTGAGGGRINTDAIDNSAGVDCSDHEVNIKIALSAAPRLNLRARDALLAKMTDEVAALVLRDNYLQGQALSLAEAEGPAGLDGFARFMQALEKSGRLDRAIESLPDDETLNELRAAKRTLARPELAVLMAYAKTTLHADLLESDLPDQAHFAGDLARYFPQPMQKPFAREIARHRLRRDIVANSAANSIVNRAGITFVHDLAEETGANAAAIARAYTLARDCFDLREYWGAIEALDNRVPANVQMKMLLLVRDLHRHATLWFLRRGALLRDLAATVRDFAPGISALRADLAAVLPANLRAQQAAVAGSFEAEQAPPSLAKRLAEFARLAAALDIVAAAAAQKRGVAPIARIYFALGERFGFERFRACAQALPTQSHWERAAASALVDDFNRQQRDLTAAVARAANGKTGGDAIERWASRRAADIGRVDRLLNELRGPGDLDFAKLTVAARSLDDVLG